MEVGSGSARLIHIPSTHSPTIHLPLYIICIYSSKTFMALHSRFYPNSYRLHIYTPITIQDLNLLHTTLHPEEDIGQVEGTNTSKATSRCLLHTKIVLVPAQRHIFGKRVYTTLKHCQSNF